MMVSYLADFAETALQLHLSTPEGCFMNLKELEYVVAIADEKSLTKAAERLFITPSALTQQVLRLENELHAPLFIRSNKNTCKSSAFLFSTN